MLPLLYAILAAAFFVYTFPDDVSAHHVIGVIVTGLSFALWIVSRVQLGNAFSLAPKSKFIVSTGIYSKLRHPVYYFSITAVLGLAVYSLNAFVFVALVALILVEIIRIRAEEKLLLSSFGKQYLEYKKSTWF